MSGGHRVWAVVATVVLAACIAGSEFTRGAMEHLPFLHAQPAGLVDQRPWQTAQALAPLAVSTEEVAFAREAERLADHEVDQAFAMALRQASAETLVLTGDALALSQKVAALEAVVKQDQLQVDTLTAQAARPGGDAVADDLEIAKAQAGLDKDQLADALHDLAHASGDKRSEIQQELTAREAAMKKYDSGVSNDAQTAVLSSARYQTLYGRLHAWFEQKSRLKLLLQARQQAESDSAAMSAQHATLQRQLQTASSASAQAQAGISPPGKASRLATIRRMTAQRAVLGILADREQTEQQLASVYQRWATQVSLQHRIVLHLILVSLAWVAAILLAAVLLAEALQRLLPRLALEPRTLATLRTVIDLGTQILTLALILIVIFGLPKQMPTIVGFATAGLTVVFQDFILGFFGWFVLMGRNGIRVGDWVEIDGVGGEVAEVGLFRTSLLETGNWTDKGHPTGRLITFINKYAIVGQYFNFSTTGQWLWDEIKVNVPPSDDSYNRIEAIRQAALSETQQDAEQAEIEWKRLASHQALSRFTASPSVDVRPAAAGTDVVVRYVTRASSRFDVRNKLYQAIVKLLNKPA